MEDEDATEAAVDGGETLRETVVLKGPPTRARKRARRKITSAELTARAMAQLSGLRIGQRVRSVAALELDENAGASPRRAATEEGSNAATGPAPERLRKRQRRAQRRQK